MDLSLHRENEQQRGQMHVLEMVATGAPLDETLAELVRLIEAQEPGLTCGILIVTDDGEHFRRGCAPGLPEVYHVALDGVPITPPYLGACGEAAHCGVSVSVPDVASDERWSDDWRNLVLSCGLASCLSTPVFGFDGRAIASFAMYYDRPRDPRPKHPEIIEMATHLAAIALERQRETEKRRRVEASLRESKLQLSRELAAAKQLQEISSALIREEDVEALYQRIVEAAASLMGSDAASMQMLDQERRELRLLAWKGFHPESAAFWQRVPVGGGSTCAAAVLYGQRITVSDVEDCDFIADSKDLDSYRLSGLRSVQSTPLFSRSGQLLGMISTHWREPRHLDDGELRLIDVLARQAADLIERTQAEAAVHHSEARFRALVSATSNAVYRMSPDWNQVQQFVDADFRGDGSDVVGGWIEHVPEDDRPEVAAAIDEAIRTGSVFSLEHRVRRTDGSIGWWASRAVPLCDKTGAVVEWFGAASDISARKGAEMRQQLLINELNHRVKNSLATVQSIVAQGLRSAVAPEDNISAITTRLTALARSHDLLTRENWVAVSLLDVAAQAMEPFRMADGMLERVAIDGAEIRLPPKQALAFGMAFHELATNAAKYGALSNGAGRVGISWLRDGDRLRLTWVERDGPPVRPPARKGFGSRLIERGLPYELGGTVRHDYRADGVVCDIDVPIPPAVDRG